MINYQHIGRKSTKTTSKPQLQTHWLSKYWFQIFLGMLCLHLFFNREISVQVKMRAPGAEAGVSSVPGSWTQPVRQAGSGGGEAAEFSSGSSFWSFGKKRAAEPDCLLPENRDASVRHVQRFSKVAMAEMKKFGVPASIILAHSLLTSQAGQHPVAEHFHNYFLLPCAPDLACQTIELDGRDQQFRQFSSAWESFREYSLIFQQADTQHFQSLGIHQYERWATELQKQFYPQDPGFAASLTRIIETLDLTQFDRG